MDAKILFIHILISPTHTVITVFVTINPYISHDDIISHTLYRIYLCDQGCNGGVTRSKMELPRLFTEGSRYLSIVLNS